MSRDAVVVGINNYQYLPNLSAPAVDAEAIAQQLQTYGEFRIHRLPEVIEANRPKVGQKTTVTLCELETALVRLFKPAGDNIPQTALFYYSGHGLQKQVGIREGYLAVSDANPQQGFYGLSLFWLRRLLQESPVRQRIILLDCCHSGELLNFLDADPGAKAGTDRLFMAASREYESAYESLTGKYSVFTDALLSGLDPRSVSHRIVTNYYLTNWVSQKLKGELQQPLFENSGSEIILTRTSGIAPPPPPPRYVPAIRQGEKVQSAKGNGLKVKPAIDLSKASIPALLNPYRGLTAFEESHAQFFSGRDTFVEELVTKLQLGRSVAVVGASGVGKTSLLRAGLVTRLRKETDWQIQWIAPTLGQLNAIALSHRPTLLIIDQFEQIFTQSPPTPQAEQERYQFFQRLIEIWQTAGNRLRIAIALRADAIEKCRTYNTLAPLLEQNWVNLPPLNSEQMRSAIIQPAAKMGVKCDRYLIETLLLDLAGSPLPLPLLQLALSELWTHRQMAPDGTQCLTQAAYQQLGGLRGILSQHATNAFNCLSLVEQKIAQRILSSLAHSGSLGKAELSSPGSAPVLEKLIASRLVAASEVAGQIAIAHKCLTHYWPLLETPNPEPALSWQKTPQSPDLGYLAPNDALTVTQQHSQAQQESKVLQVGIPVALAMAIAIALNQYRAVSLSETNPHPSSAAKSQVKKPFQQLRENLSTRLSPKHSPEEQLHPTVLNAPQLVGTLPQLTLTERPMAWVAFLPDRLTPTLVALEADPGEFRGWLLELSDRQSTVAKTPLKLHATLEQMPQTPITGLALSRHHSRIAIADSTGKVTLWQLQADTSLEFLKTLDLPQTQASGISYLSFRPDGQKLLGVGHNHQQVYIWDTESGKRQQTLQGHEAPITQAQFSPNGQQVITASWDRTACLWQVKHPKAIATFAHPAALSSAAFSPDSRFVVTATWDKTAKIWNAATGELKGIFAGHTEPVLDAQFSADGRSLVTASADGTARVWDTQTGRETMVLQTLPQESHPRDPLERVFFSPDMQYVGALSEQGYLSFWKTSVQTAQF